MPLETATSISQLNASNPAHTDGLNQADAHMRLIKSVLQAQFPGFVSAGSAALASSQTQLDAAVASTVTHTAPLVAQAGAATTPGLYLVGDATTGLSLPVTGQLNVIASGANPLTVNSLGVFVTGLNVSGNITGTANAAIIPIGGTIMWWGTSLPNSDTAHWAWCNGATIVGGVASYPSLATALGASFQSGGNLILPDLRETLPMGVRGMGGAASRGLINPVTPIIAGSLTTVNSVIGETAHTQQTGEVAAHQHPPGTLAATAAAQTWTYDGTTYGITVTDTRAWGVNVNGGGGATAVLQTGVTTGTPTNFSVNVTSGTITAAITSGVVQAHNSSSSVGSFTGTTGSNTQTSAMNITPPTTMVGWIIRIA